MQRNSKGVRQAVIVLGILGRVAFGQALLCTSAGAGGSTAAVTTPFPIMFVTQIPIHRDFTTANAMFGNHKAGVNDAGRGGDLYIRYPDGTLKNLTLAAGYGNAGFQGLSSIAVRDPDVHWDGQKAVFSMAIGSVEARYQVASYRWQLYEVTGLGVTDTPVITKVTNQPQGFNNIMPIYGTDDRIIFVSDRPRNGAAHLYPQLDEYELAPSNSGLWSLDPANGDLKLLDHSPSGDFYPLIDSFGRVLFTRWDHLQRDQQADADSAPGLCSTSYYGTFNYSDESDLATIDMNDRTEVFPEPRACRTDLLAGTNLEGHTFNQFFPWMINEDGTALETLNHVGRHEFSDYFARGRTDDPNILYFVPPGPRLNQKMIFGMTEMAESPVAPGTYFGIDAPEFATHAAGQIVSVTGDPATYADKMVVTWFTHRDTSGATDTPSPDHSGLYRDPLVLADGTVVAAHTYETREDRNEGTRTDPISRYSFRLETLALGGNGHHAASEMLTTGINKTVSYWDPDEMVNFSGLMWELHPIEVRTRTRPVRPAEPLQAPEAQMFAEAGVDPAAFRTYLADNGLALVVSRDVTTRDQADRQQAYNLRVPGGVSTIATTGTVYDVSHMQFFQADQLRGWKGCCGSDPNPGRRVLARPLHDAAALGCDPTPVGAPEGGKVVEADGSLAALVPARRALTWQLTSPTGEGIVRERYWLSFQPGEVRVCASCHGLNSKDQLGRSEPQNPPQALKKLLQQWTGCVAAPARLLRNATVTDLLTARALYPGMLPLSDPMDFYQALTTPGELDGDTTVVGDATRPLVFYALPITNRTVRLTKTAAGRIAVHY